MALYNKYITIEDKDIECGMTSSGRWICKSLKAKTEDEAGEKMLNMNIKLNEANKQNGGEGTGKKKN